MGHLGSRTIASEMLERVSYGDKTTLSVDLPWETECMGAWSDPRVHEDPKTNRAFFIILHSLEEYPLQPNPFHRCDLNDAMWLIAVFGHLQSFQVVCWDKPRVQNKLSKPGEHAEGSGGPLENDIRYTFARDQLNPRSNHRS